MQTSAHVVVGIVLVTAMVTVFSPSPSAQPTPVFHGRPGLKISEGGMERVPTMLTERLGTPLEVVITKEDDRYYWATRQNTEMAAVRRSAFTTFIALNGTGYVRVMGEDAADTGFAVTPTEAQFDYVEHILLGLNSITYYGNRLEPLPSQDEPTPR